MEILLLLMDKGADPRRTNADGWTPLHLAARAGNVKKTALLL